MVITACVQSKPRSGDMCIDWFRSITQDLFILISTLCQNMTRNYRIIVIGSQFSTLLESGTSGRLDRKYFAALSVSGVLCRTLYIKFLLQILTLKPVLHSVADI